MNDVDHAKKIEPDRKSAPADSPVLNYQSSAEKPLSLPVFWVIAAVMGQVILFKISVLREWISTILSVTIGLRYGSPESLAEWISCIFGLGGLVLFLIGAYRVLVWKGKRDDLLWRNRNSERPSEAVQTGKAGDENRPDCNIQPGSPSSAIVDNHSTLTEPAFSVEQTSAYFKMCVRPRRIDQLRLVVFMVLCLCVASVFGGFAVFITFSLGRPFTIGAVLFLGLAGLVACARMLLLAIGSGKRTLIEIGSGNMTVKSFQLLTFSKVFPLSRLKRVAVKTVIGPVAVLEIYCGYDEPARVLLGHDVTQLRIIAGQINTVLKV